MAVQAQPLLLPAESAQLPLKKLQGSTGLRGLSGTPQLAAPYTQPTGEWEELVEHMPQRGPPGPSPCTWPTWEPVQPSRAKGNWLQGVTTRSTLTAFQAGWDSGSAPLEGSGRRRMQRLRSKASMVWLCWARRLGSPKRLRWCWWYRTRSCGESRCLGLAAVRVQLARQDVGRSPGSAAGAAR